MTTNGANRKRIAKNTLLLYARTLITLMVNLYTSRVVLQVLGVSDYGVYNVVGGIVTILSFLSSALTAASQRFISFELGKGNKDRLRTVFCTSVTIHALLAVIVFVFAETAGLWFLNNRMNIEAGRMLAANWVYQCSILSFMLLVVSVPYNACIVAHEYMSVYAYVNILEVVLKLVVVYVLLVTGMDKLIAYALLMVGVSFMINTVYTVYCRRHFEECRYKFEFDKPLFKEMFAFSGWSFVGNMGFSLKDPAMNIILNLFFGTVVNAAKGVANQVNGVISQFSGNFIMALNPQITKQYAGGNVEESRSLVYSGCRYAFYLFAIVAVPVYVNIDYLLGIWLVEVPEYTSAFLRLTLLAAMINSMVSPITTAIQATGNIKLFQIAICVLMLSELPIGYVMLVLGAGPYAVMYPTVAIAFIALFVRFIILHRQVSGYSLRHFAVVIVGKNLLIGAVCLMVGQMFREMLDESFLTFVQSALVSVLMVGTMVFAFGLGKWERQLAIGKIKEMFQRH